MLTDSMKRRLTALIDPEYERAVNKLIPAAEKFANKCFGAKGPGGKNIKAKAEWAAKWNFCFHQKREMLYRESKQNKSYKPSNGWSRR